MPETPNVPTAADIFNMMLAAGTKNLATLENNAGNAVAVSEGLLSEILKDNSDTIYGKKYNFAGIKSVAEFKENVPFSQYDDYAEYIERMERGETGLITNYPIVHYAVTSGSVGNPKHVPVSKRTVELYSMYGTSIYYAAAEEYYQKNFGRPVNRGRALCSLEVIMKYAEDHSTVGCITAAAVDTLKKIAPILFSSPLLILFPKTPT